MRMRLACLAAWLSAAGCFSVAYFNRSRQAIEGAYFDEGGGSSVIEGGKSYRPASDDEYSVFSPFDFWNAYLWLGMGVALALVGTLLLIAAKRRAV